jgi:hypothetical protein
LQLQEKLAAKGAGENPEAAGAAARLCETGNDTPGGEGWGANGTIWDLECKFEDEVKCAE